MSSTKSLSPFRQRLRRFRRLKRGYYSFLLLVGSYLLTFLLPFLMNSRAIVVHYDGQWLFPAARCYLYDTFGIGREKIYLGEMFDQRDSSGQMIQGEANYRELREQFASGEGSNFAIVPPMPYDPFEQFLTLEGNPPHRPSRDHWFGTDDRGRDVFVRLAYGYRMSISFALMVTIIAYSIGIVLGAIFGYYGRWLDILGQRLVEIWGAIPFLYTVIILASIFSPSFLLLVAILAAFGWMQITYYVRGEFYREKAKDYVSAALATGENNLTIVLRHILPNALNPIVTFAPFSIVASIVALVSLDFLGFGLSPPTPSWGELLNQAKQNLKVWHLVVFPLGAMFLTLQLIVFIGEGVREAFDPKVLSRLR